MRDSWVYAVAFAAAVCVVCSVLVSGSAVLLEERQVQAASRDRARRVLVAAGLIGKGERISAAELERLLAEHVVPRLVELRSGAVVEGDVTFFDQRAAAQDPETSRPAPPNKAEVTRLPDRAIVYEVRDAGELAAIVLPIEGKGLWSTLYGFLALSAEDLRTVKGIVFYEHGETPGLGGEVDNPKWTAQWVGRQAFDERWQPVLRVARGSVGPAMVDPYQVDGITGATLTARGVTHLVQFWLGEHGFGPYLRARRRERGIR